MDGWMNIQVDRKRRNIAEIQENRQVIGLATRDILLVDQALDSNIYIDNRQIINRITDRTDKIDRADRIYNRG